MNPNNATTAPHWSTASSQGDWCDASLVDLSALEAHLHLCKRLSGRLFSLRCSADSVRGFMAHRLMTSLVVMSLLISLSFFTL
jgi:hypothetical protein